MNKNRPDFIAIEQGGMGIISDGTPSNVKGIFTSNISH